MTSRHETALDTRCPLKPEPVPCQDGQPHPCEERLRESEALRAAMIVAALDCVVTIDDQGLILEFNPAAERTFGYRREAAIGRSIADLIIPPHLRDAHNQGLRRYLATGERRILGYRVETEGMRVDGSPIPVELTITDTTSGGRRLFTAYLRDISERRRFEDELYRLAYHDPLTTLPNRLLLLRRLEEATAAGRPFALMILDVDRFGTYRNSLGHAFADAVLITLARRLTGTIGPDDLAARTGDHAFAVLLDGIDDPVGAAPRIDAIVQALHEPVPRAGGAFALTASIGIAPRHGDHQRAEEVLNEAEIASMRVLERGGAGYAWFDQNMHDQIVEQVQTEHDLRAALDSGTQLWLAYQPIIDLTSGRLVGFEALARWQHPRRGSIPPVAFIPVAENTGLILPLGKFVLAQACRQLAEWQERRVPGTAPLFMSINLSPRQLDEPGFTGTVDAILAEAGVDPARIKLEITEGAVMERTEEAIKLLRELKRLGVHLSIDDFGTGYSSLSYLHKLPVDALKIDRSFVIAMHQSNENRQIVRIIVDLARILGLDVVAEGIETAADADLLLALGCDYGQGYHFARPLTATDADALVQGHLPWRTGE